MVVVLDAYALEAYLADEPSAPLVEAILLSGEQVLISAVNFAETADRLMRVYGVEMEAITADFLETGCTISGVDPDMAFDAAQLRATHYHRTTRAVSVPDCFAAALSLSRDARLVTSDPALLDMVRAEGGDSTALPDSHGVVHSPPA